MGSDMLKLSVEYWIKRLDHTLEHTQSSSKLIYILDGAVIALAYFIVKELAYIFGNKNAVLIASFPMFVLTILNLMHAHLLEIQRLWYQKIDDKLLNLLSLEPVWKEKGKYFDSTHKIYRTMHYVVAVALFVMAIFMVLYGCSCLC